MSFEIITSECRFCPVSGNATLGRTLFGTFGSRPDVLETCGRPINNSAARMRAGVNGDSSAGGEYAWANRRSSRRP